MLPGQWMAMAFASCHFTGTVLALLLFSASFYCGSLSNSRSPPHSCSKDLTSPEGFYPVGVPVSQGPIMVTGSLVELSRNRLSSQSQFHHVSLSPQSQAAWEQATRLAQAV